jgi:RimJ/RimL family protein N-acetyltransferase
VTADIKTQADMPAGMRTHSAPDDIVIRALDAADVADYADLRVAAIDDAPAAFWPTRDEEMGRSTADIAARLRPTRNQIMFGAFYRQQLVGIAGLRREALRKVRHKGTVWGVFVAPRWRRRGVARALLQAVIAHARELGDLVQIHLYVNSENPSARALYAGLGFIVYGREPRSMRVGEVYYDEELMVLFLDREASPSGATALSAARLG